MLTYRLEDCSAIRLPKAQRFELLVPHGMEAQCLGFFLRKEAFEDRGDVYCHRFKIISKPRAIESDLFVGEIMLSSEQSALPVYVQATGRTQGLSVVNPLGAMIDMRPGQVLEVIIRSDLDLIHTAVEGGFELRHVRTESFFREDQELHPPSLFRWLSPPMPNSHEHHFWFYLNPTARQSHVCLKIRFTAKGCGWLRYQVLVRVADGAGPPENSVLMVQEAHSTGLLRYIDEKRGLIINPAAGETVEFSLDQENVIMELPRPSWSCSDAKEDQDWKFEIKKLWGKEHRIEIKELRPRFVNYTRVQRFLVKSKIDMLPMGIDQMSLGSMYFWYDGSTGLRTINFRLVRYHQKQNVRQCYCQITKVDIEDLSSDLSTGVKLLPMRVPEIGYRTITNPASNMTVLLGPEATLQIIFTNVPITQGKGWENTFCPSFLTRTVQGYTKENQFFTFRRKMDVGNISGGTLTFANNNDVTRKINIYIQVDHGFLV